MPEEISNFIHDIIDKDLAEGVNTEVHTRFPPEPNGYLHIGSAKAIWINAYTAEKYHGKFNLRYDDTNPAREDDEYVQSILQDIRWLGFEPNGGIFYGSDYFDKCYEYAEKLIMDGKAYVDDLTREEMQEYRGNDAGKPSRPSPYRDRSVEENLDLFRRMRAGEFEDGAKTLRAKIDMSSPNINLRDPALYRIIHRSHHQTGDKWCIYPMYDFAHPIQDAIEGVTHSLCSLEYEIHRPLYDWVTLHCDFEKRPRQIEFARLNMTNTIMSKRYLRRLVEEGFVSGWDDPRMPTLCAMRRRGYPAEAIIDFLDKVGVSKADSVVDTAMLEHCVREKLNATAPRMMAILDPIKLIVTNWPEGETESVTLENLPGSEEAGKRTVQFGRELYIERDDFMVKPPKKYFRLKPDGEVRLKGAYIVKCTGYDADENDVVREVYCTYDPDTKSGECERKVKGTLHWLNAADALDAEFRLYEPMMLDTDEECEDFTEKFNRDSLITINGKIEPALANAHPGDKFQFMRIGYFAADKDFTDTRPVFNRTVGLKDSFKLQ